jgi:hypothetical protein
MNAKALRPYLFWIICGVVLIVELVAFAVISPAIPDKPGVTPVSARQAADQAVKDLKSLTTRANATLLLSNGPTAPFDPEDAAARSRMLSQYFTTPSWEQPIRDRLTQIQAQKTLITSELEERSKSLREPILADANAEPDTWGYAYAALTGSHVKKLVDAGLLAPSGGAARNDAKFYETDRGLRDQIALYTTDGRWPDRNEHAGLALRFRIIQRLTDALAAVAVPAQPNPGIDGKLVPMRSEPERVRLNRLAFQGQPSGSNPRSLRVSLDLDGTPNALTEAMRVLDDLSQPITIRIGATWERLGVNQGGPQYDEPRMRVTCELVIFDFAPTGKGA